MNNLVKINEYIINLKHIVFIHSKEDKEIHIKFISDTNIIFTFPNEERRDAVLDELTTCYGDFRCFI